MRVITPWAVIGSFDSSRALFTLSRVRSEEPAVVSSTRAASDRGAPLSTRILRAAVRPAVLVANGVVPAVPAARLNLVCSAVRSASTSFTAARMACAIWLARMLR